MHDQYNYSVNLFGTSITYLFLYDLIFIQAEASTSVLEKGLPEILERPLNSMSKK